MPSYHNRPKGAKACSTCNRIHNYCGWLVKDAGGFVHPACIFPQPTTISKTRKKKSTETKPILLPNNMNNGGQ